MSKKFVRQDYMRYSKIGKNRKKIQKWRRPKGRDSKMRLKLAGYPKKVSVGYKRESAMRGRIEGKKPMKVYNLNDIKKSKNNSLILGKIGARKKIELIKRANELGMKFVNVQKQGDKK